MRQQGAKKVVADYVTPGSIATAIERANSRANNPKSPDYGRKVAESFIKANHRDISRTWIGAARNGVFDSQRLCGNVGGPKDPLKLIAEVKGKQIIVHDKKLFEEFRLLGK